MRFTNNKSQTCCLSLAAFLLISVFAFTGITFAVETLVYDNSSVNGYYQGGVGLETLDYGTTDGGCVTKFTVGYYPSSLSVGSITIRFYKYTDSNNYPGQLIKTITLNDLPNGSGYQFYTYTLSPSEQFLLPDDNFGYSYTFSNPNTYSLLASGGHGNDDILYLNFGLFLPVGVSDGWAGLYMKVYTGPPLPPATVSGYKFDDVNGNGVWDEGEEGISGWRIYIDENNNGIWDIDESYEMTEPNGYYEFLNLPTPDTITVAEVMQDGWRQTFPGVPEKYQLSLLHEDQYINKTFGNKSVATDVTISGHVKLSDDSGLEGVLMEASGLVTGNTLTDQNGYYEIITVSGWSGTIQASKDGWTLSGPVTVTNITTDQMHDFTAYWSYSGGDGTEVSPYQISTVQDLLKLGERTDDYDKYFVLTNDIDLAGNTYSGAIIASTLGHPAILDDFRFRGQFDGAGFSILNLSSNSGLFGYIRNAVIKNLGVENVEITNGGTVGAICNYNHGSTIENCFSTGNITGKYGVGGLCGAVHRKYRERQPIGLPMPAVNKPVIKKCYSTVNVILKHPNSIPETGTVSSAGGLCAYTEGADIINNYAYGSVDGTGCWTPFDFNIVSDNGGLVGYIKYCTVYNNYSSGHVVNGRAYSKPGGFCGLVSGDSAHFTGNFWDTQTSDQQSSAAGTGLTTADMKTKQIFIDAGWDFVGETANGNDDIWRICDGFDYPHLNWEEMVAGDIACPDGVGIEDFAAIAAQWGLSRLDGDVWPDGGDGIIDMRDAARLSATWLSVSPQAAFDERCDLPLAAGDGTINVGDLEVVAYQWLEKSIYSADIAPADGDNAVDSLDLAIIGENWLTGR